MAQPADLTPSAPSSVGTRIVQAVERIESEPRLDGPAAVLDKAASALTQRDRGRVLQGATIGHALHPH
jgi:hypothetical protein